MYILQPVLTTSQLVLVAVAKMSANVNTYSSEGSPERKYEEKTYDPNVAGTVGDDEPVDNNHHLHRNLSSRQITMIAIGGAIGTGLIIGT